jgi:hypothetical protein
MKASRFTEEQIIAILRSLVEAILLVPEDGTLRVEVRGELAGILALVDSKKPAASLSAPGAAAG